MFTVFFKLPLWIHKEHIYWTKFFVFFGWTSKVRYLADTFIQGNLQLLGIKLVYKAMTLTTTPRHTFRQTSDRAV